MGRGPDGGENWHIGGIGTILSAMWWSDMTAGSDTRGPRRAGNEMEDFALPARRRGRGMVRRLTLLALTGGLLAAGVTVGAGAALAGLYPGNAVNNAKELGLVTVSADGQSLTVQTQDAGMGGVPSTSFACLTAAASAQITHRLQQTQCAAIGGVWFPFAGGSLTIDLTAYPQFLDTAFTVQVAANRSAENANGDAFFNNFSVSTLTGGGGIDT